MAQQSVPTPNFTQPITDGQGNATRWFQAFVTYLYSRVGGANDKIDQAYQTAMSAVPRSTQVVAGGGLQVGGPLSGNVGLALYAVQSTVALLPATGMSEGDFAYALDGRKTGEAAGAGTGVPVWFSNGGWYAIDSGALAAA